MRKLAFIFITTGIGFFLFSCWLPPFDEQASLAALSERNLTSRFSISNVEVPKGFQAKFVPVIASKRGAFLFLESSSELKVKYVTATSAYAPSTNDIISLSTPIKDWDDTAVVPVFGSTSSGGTPTAYLFLPDAAVAGADTDHFYYSYSSGLMSEIVETNSTRLIENIATEFSLTASDLRLLGFNTLLTDTEDQKSIVVLVYSTTAEALYEFELVYDTSFSLTASRNINTAYRGTSSQTVAVPSGAEGISFGRYFYDPAYEKSYFNYPENGAYVTYVWDVNTAPTVFSQIKEKVEIILSTGEIVTQKEGLGKVYDGSNGAYKYSFPLGTLAIAYETYISDEPNILFVKPLPMDSERTEYKYFVYSVPTENLSTLEQK